MNHHVIISGGSKGIGKALAIKYASEGSHVTIIARNEKDLQEAKEEIEKHRKNDYQDIRSVSLDLTKLTFATKSAGQTMTSEQKDTLDRILGPHNLCNLLINCCGSSISSKFEDTTQDQFRQMMEVNYFSAVNLTRLLLPLMKERSEIISSRLRPNEPSGGIVFVSSICGLVSFFGYSAYSASKFALVGLAEALQMELRELKIDVIVSFPPDTDTPGYEEENKIKPAVTSEISKSGKVYRPEDVAESIIRDVKARKFYSTVGSENWLIVLASNAFMPKTFLGTFMETVIAGPLRVIAFFIVKWWYSLASRASDDGERSRNRLTRRDE